MDHGQSTIILASASRSRASLLRNAGVSFEISAPLMDEEEPKLSLRADGAAAGAMTEALAGMKALDVSRRYPGRLVIGADQILESEGRQFDKPADRADARRQLRQLRGRRHCLFTSAVACRDEQQTWRRLSRATLTVRALSDGFIEDYLDTIGDAALWGPGAYQIEGEGAQLFSHIEGDYFAILGLPLLPLLDYLRLQGALGT